MTWYIGLSIGYALLGALLLALIIASPYAKSLKLSMIILLSLFYVATYRNFHNMRGWAVPERPEANFKLHWAVVEEPNKALGEKGAIYILGQKIGALGLLEQAPRLYEVPFDPELAQQIEEAKSEIEDGNPLEATLTIKAVDRDLDKPEETDQREGQYGEDREANQLVLTFRDIPRPDLPPKR